jgi:hypothetical protein
MYNERLFVKASKGLYIAGLSESEISESSQEITTSYQVLSQKLLGRYAQIQVSIFTFKIREYVAHPLLVDQVTVVSPIWRNIQSKMEEIHLNVRNSFKEVKRQSGLKGSQPILEELKVQKPHLELHAKLDTAAVRTLIILWIPSISYSTSD